MNGLDLLLVGAVVGLLLGVMMQDRHPQVVTPVYMDERRGGCAGMFVVLALAGTLLIVLTSLPTLGW